VQKTALRKPPTFVEKTSSYSDEADYKTDPQCPKKGAHHPFSQSRSGEDS